MIVSKDESTLSYGTVVVVLAARFKARILTFPVLEWRIKEPNVAIRRFQFRKCE